MLAFCLVRHLIVLATLPFPHPAKTTNFNAIEKYLLRIGITAF
jgi:hypothetical protein